MPYKENPKTKDSGILCCIPQTNSRCHYSCGDCFYQNGRSYLHPIENNIPNMPPMDMITSNTIVRVNDGLDSSIQRGTVETKTQQYPRKFFNTSSLIHLALYPGPVVLTLNPGKDTDIRFHKLGYIPSNLMFLRFRINTWNTELATEAINYYHKFPIILTWVAYHDLDDIPLEERARYELRTRTSNEYYAIKHSVWFEFMKCVQKRRVSVYSCGIEGKTSSCKNCGNCVREYHNTMVRIG